MAINIGEYDKRNVNPDEKLEKANQEQKEELFLQKRALGQFEQTLNTNHQELIHKQKWFRELWILCKIIP